MVKKEQGQDDYFNQKSIFLTSKYLCRLIKAYRRRTNFCGHNISWVKFSRGQIFVGGGSPQKFNPHEKLFTSSTRNRNGVA